MGEPVEPTSSISLGAEASKTPTINGDFISLEEELKSVPYFKGDKQ
jgi:hypothetical protein